MLMHTILLPFFLYFLPSDVTLQTSPFDIVLYDECFRAIESLGVGSDLDLPFSILDPEGVVHIVPVRDGVYIISVVIQR